MVADIHTKAFNGADLWRHATHLCNVVDPEFKPWRIKEHCSTFGVDDCNPGGKPSNNTSSKISRISDEDAGPTIAHDVIGSTSACVALVCTGAIEPAEAMSWTTITRMATKDEDDAPSGPLPPWSGEYSQEQHKAVASSASSGADAGAGGQSASASSGAAVTDTLPQGAGNTQDEDEDKPP